MSNSKTTGYQALSRDVPQDILVDTVNRHTNGRINVVQTGFTLRINQTTTTLTDERIGPNSFIWFMPTTAHASAALTNIYVTSQVKGAATVNHSSSANADQTFTAIIIGG